MTNEHSGKRMVRVALMALMALVVLLLAACGVCGASAEEVQAPAAGTVYCEITAGVEIRSTAIDGENWLFLPACAKLNALTLYVDDVAELGTLQWRSEKAGETPFENGGVVNISAIADEVEPYVLGVTLQSTDGAERLTLRVMQSENLRSFYITSDDPQQNREWLEDCERHERSTSATMVMLSTNGHVDHSANIRKLRGRGNGTWTRDKRAYQLKLEHKDDLLDTGRADEQNRTWILLADAMDPTLLHNRVTFDMALEIGIESTPHSEHVDMYYDGEYRGTYLLCEKVEVNKGRVEIEDYDKLLEALNEAAGTGDPEDLPVLEAVNAYGNRYTYIDGIVEGDNPGMGGFLLEMESKNTLSDRCWFRLSNGTLFATKNPENAGQKMMAYVSEVMEAALRTLTNRGVNPDTGLGVDAYFDVEAFARLALVAELSRNADCFVYSSTFFVLPQGTTRLEPGPIWDSDLAYYNASPLRYSDLADMATPTGLKQAEGWLPAFYSSDVFREAMQRIYEDTLYPAVRDILLGQEKGTYLQPLDAYIAYTEPSRRMNYKIWPVEGQQRYRWFDTYEENLEDMRAFITERNEWLYQTVMDWTAFDPNRVTLTLDAVYTLVADSVRITSDMYCGNGVVRTLTVTQLSDATETDYAVWQAEAIIDPQSGTPFGEAVQVTLNGKPVACERLSDGAIRICVTFEDESYRPVDNYGEDIGLVYNADIYAANYPELAQEYEDDPEGLMTYFCDEGVYEGHVANGFFNPRLMLECMPELMDSLGEDWYSYYFEFIYSGYVDWMKQVQTRFVPQVTDAL